MKQAATVIAAFVYQAAMMNEKIPRKTVMLANGGLFSTDKTTAMILEKLEAH